MPACGWNSQFTIVAVHGILAAEFLHPAMTAVDTEETFLGEVTGASDCFKSSAAWVAGDGTKHSFTPLVGETETNRKADIDSCHRAESSFSFSSWDGGKGGLKDVSRS
jgi:hypothetical protein